MSQLSLNPGLSIFSKLALPGGLTSAVEGDLGSHNIGLKITSHGYSSRFAGELAEGGVDCFRVACNMSASAFRKPWT